jgi:hypothetical protein
MGNQWKWFQLLPGSFIRDSVEGNTLGYFTDNPALLVLGQERG